MDKIEDLVAVISDPRSVIAEAYRGLRTSIQKALSSGVKTVMFTSVYGGDGKSTVCSNVAVALTQLYLDVVLVDCDLRRPTISNLFGALDHVGLGDYLAGQAELESVFMPTAIERLKLVPAGRILGNPGDLLGRPVLRTFCEKVREQADVVIFDTSPLSACSDALSLGRHMDTSVLVIAPRRWDGEVEVRIRQALDHHNIPIMGIVLNGVDPSEGYGYGTYGYNQKKTYETPYGYYGYGEEHRAPERRKKSLWGRVKDLFGPEG